MDNNIAFLAGDVGRLFRKRFELATRELGITSPQWRMILRISDNPGINQGALAAMLEVEAITAGRMIDRLERLGLVERRSDPGDRRAWLLHLTDRARPLLDQLRSRAATVIAESTETLSPEELAQLVAMLSRVRKRLLQGGETPPVAAHG